MTREDRLKASKQLDKQCMLLMLRTAESFIERIDNLPDDTNEGYDKCAEEMRETMISEIARHVFDLTHDELAHIFASLYTQTQHKSVEKALLLCTVGSGGAEGAAANLQTLIKDVESDEN